MSSAPPSFLDDLADLDRIEARLKKLGARAVPGFPGYFVTRRAALYSTRRGGKVRRIYGWIDIDGYRMHRLPSPSGPKYRRLHQLVAWTWLPEPEPGMTLVRHDDGNKLNCKASNLLWGDDSSNQLDRRRHRRPKKKRSRKTHRMGNEKLGIADVLEIRKKLEEGAAAAELARAHDVHPQTIHRIRRGLAWRKVAA